MRQCFHTQVDDTMAWCDALQKAGASGTLNAEPSLELRRTDTAGRARRSLQQLVSTAHREQSVAQAWVSVDTNPAERAATRAAAAAAALAAAAREAEARKDSAATSSPATLPAAISTAPSGDAERAANAAAAPAPPTADVLRRGVLNRNRKWQACSPAALKRQARADNGGGPFLRKALTNNDATYDSSGKKELVSPGADSNTVSEGGEVLERRPSAVRRDAFANVVNLVAAAEEVVAPTPTPKPTPPLQEPGSVAGGGAAAVGGGAAGVTVATVRWAADLPGTSAAAATTGAGGQETDVHAAAEAEAEAERAVPTAAEVAVAARRGVQSHIRSPSHSHSFIRLSAEAAARSVLRLRGGAPHQPTSCPHSYV